MGGSAVCGLFSCEKSKTTTVDKDIRTLDKNIQKDAEIKPKRTKKNDIAENIYNKKKHTREWDAIDNLELDVHLTEHCNLNCKGCCHFAPLAKKEFLHPSEFERDISKFSEILNHKIQLLQLLGGEPLLHPNVTSFFPIARKNFPGSSICIVTNGILLKSMNRQFWKACRKDDIMIYVSKYDIDIDIKSVKAKARKHGVTIVYTPWNTWYKISLDLNGGDKSKCEYNFARCFGSHSTTLKHGKIYNCFLMAHIEHFNKYFNQNLKPAESDILDIYKTKDSIALKRFLERPKDFCKYCHIPFNVSEWSHPSKKNISEWT